MIFSLGQFFLDFWPWDKMASTYCEEKKDNVSPQKIKDVPNPNLQQEEPNSKKKKELSKYTKCLLCEKSFKYPYVLKRMFRQFMGVKNFLNVKYVIQNLL